MLPQGSQILNLPYFTSLTSQINRCTSCADLQALVTKAWASLAAQYSAIGAIQSDLAAAEAMLTALQSLEANPTSIFNFLTGAFKTYVQQQYAPYATYVSKLTALEGQVTTLASLVTSKASSFQNCSITIPPL